MALVRRAVIDVGTNSIKLLVADVAGHEVRPVWEESKQTRLGRGFYENHRLQAAAIKATAEAVTRFAAVAREQQAVSVRVVATSAAREAVNAPDLTGAIAAASGLATEVISGEREAEWVFRGVTTDKRLAQEPLLLLDVGGGSAEFILGLGEQAHFQQSFPVGTVRLMEKLPHSDPPRPEELAACRRWLKEFMEQEVRPQVEPAMRKEAGGENQRSEGRGWVGATRVVQLVGTGGTASILGCMEAELAGFDRERLEATRLSRERLHWHVRRLWGLPLEERVKIVGLPKNRADVILTGVVIYEAIMEQFSFEQLRISTRGLRFAAVMEPM
jgi:exopolyphosphatase / guanosine-5'-triphosphate,3'-diphosphate pyrophosphatase